MWDLIVSVPDHCLSFYFSKSFILDGIKLILENNNFCFDNIHYNISKVQQGVPCSHLFIQL